MTRNACLNHPKDKVIEIPKGFRYCERCHHLVPPEMEIVEIIEETPLEAIMKDTEKRVLKAMGVEAEPVEETEAVVEAPKEAVEAEVEVKEPLEESPEETAPAEVVEPIEEEAVVEIPVEEAKDEQRPTKAEIDKTVEIARLKALLAELEPEDE